MQEAERARVRGFREDVLVRVSCEVHVNIECFKVEAGLDRRPVNDVKRGVGHCLAVPALEQRVVPLLGRVLVAHELHEHGFAPEGRSRGVVARRERVVHPLPEGEGVAGSDLADLHVLELGPPDDGHLMRVGLCPVICRDHDGSQELFTFGDSIREAFREALLQEAQHACRDEQLGDAARCLRLVLMDAGVPRRRGIGDVEDGYIIMSEQVAFQDRLEALLQLGIFGRIRREVEVAARVGQVELDAVVSPLSTGRKLAALAHARVALELPLQTTDPGTGIFVGGIGGRVSAKDEQLSEHRDCESER